MILQSLVSYYEALAEKGGIARPGWAEVKVSWALEIDENGKLLDILPLKTKSGDGGKMVPRSMTLPAPVKRTVAIDPNFLFDNSAYILGFDNKGKPERAKNCFDAAKKLHISLLGGLENSAAKAVCAFFENWRPEIVGEEPLIAKNMEELNEGGNIAFMFDGEFLQNRPEIAVVWQNYYDGSEDGDIMRCLITGRLVVPQKTHPAIKGVRGAQSSGAALVSFNAEAYCSYERKQNMNAPVGKYAAFAYTTSLNQLLADKKHVKQVGDTTVV
ncbi:MAG: type I-C CRISPR-associated protein Cas8c/Csd1, partial [Oscillospiraceae bacterium]